jgi:hypothetical protein
MMKPLHLAAYVLVSGGVAFSAFAQEAKPPSDNELRSAYCVAVLKQQIPWFQGVVAKVDAQPPSLPGRIAIGRRVRSYNRRKQRRHTLRR